MTLILPLACREAMADHARSRYPLECCGLLLGKRHRSPTESPNDPAHQTVQQPIAHFADQITEIIETRATENAWDRLAETFAIDPDTPDPIDRDPRQPGIDRAGTDLATSSPDNLGTIASQPTQAWGQERRYAIDPQDLLAALKDGRTRDLAIIGIYHSHPNAPAVPSGFDRNFAWPDYSYVILSVHSPQANDPIDLQAWQLDAQGKFQPDPIQPDPIQPEPIIS